MVNQPKIPENLNQHRKLEKSFNKLSLLVEELNKKEIPEEIQEQINQEIEQVDAFMGSDNQHAKFISSAYNEILKRVRKALGLVPKHYYQNLWTALGLSVFGVPLGIAYAATLDSPAMFSIGIAMGLPIGLAIGIGMDKKANKEGKQLQVG
jgi:hypothetical protein